MIIIIHFMQVVKVNCILTVRQTIKQLKTGNNRAIKNELNTLAMVNGYQLG